MKILVVEDQDRLGRFLQQGLTQCAYTVTLVGTCAEASDALVETHYDAVGLELLNKWRKAGFKEPVLILSARDGVQDRIKGLNLGADDYLPKPFNLEELLARVRSLVRRQSSAKQVVLEHAGIQLDLVRHTVEVDGEAVDLTSREYALLEVFMQNQGRILPRTLISEKIWASHYDVDTNLLDVYMSRLRSKLESHGRPFFKTVRGVGYQML
jgi:DNA-binding response OmpR family regulator